MKSQKETRKITNDFILENFGVSSPIYTSFRDQIISWWEKEEYCELLDDSLKNWSEYFQFMYMDPENFRDLFINHSYLLILANLLIKSYLDQITTSQSDKKEVINGVITDFSIDNLAQFPFLEYLRIEELEFVKKKTVTNILEKLKIISNWRIKEDIFQGIYEQLVNKSNRHEKGEYYTPNWLSQLIIEEVWDLWEEGSNYIKKPPTVLDPACGSGTFIFNFQFYYYNSLDSSKKSLLEVFGFDINPIAVYLTQINSVFSLPVNIFVKAVNQKSFFYRNFLHRDALNNNPLLDYVEETLNGYKFDILVGNPPWIVLRSITNTDYQKKLKEDFIRYNLVLKKDVHLFTQLDLATLFFMKCSRQYLEKGGITAFVMPKSVISGAIQHE